MLRILPITIDLCAALDTPSIASLITTERRNRTSAAPGNDLIVYPGSLQTRDSAEADIVRATYRIGHSDRDMSEPSADVAPLSPLEVFSVNRLARALRWATLGTDARRYPHLVPMPADERSALAECGWLEPRADSVAILRSPLPDELDRVPALLGRSHSRRSSGRAGEHETRRLHDLQSALGDAADTTALLETCPVCTKTDLHRPTIFEPRDNGLFAASCPSCNTRWELRRCLTCSKTFPLLVLDGLATAGTHEPGLERRLGGAFLAIPCWAEDRANHFICPACDTCGQAARAHSCPRGCSARAPS